MNPKLTVKGLEEVYIALQHASDDIADKARKAMRRSADRIVTLAKLQTPVDKHNLEESIRIEKEYGFRGRLQINIVMGGFVNGVNVDRYAVEVHENYDSAHMGPGTFAKQQMNPGIVVGRKFLTRAAEKEGPKLEAQALRAIEKRYTL